ncbi:MAG: DUF4382 domain-containing protein [Candidatus Diapherotrites archaeon]|nr:DUF4382 domain-containing protein [Candidatus Diapherotrites archaeon]MDZ4256841.1 DUF4382 domain-containing protein [archaeon]
MKATSHPRIGWGLLAGLVLLLLLAGCAQPPSSGNNIPPAPNPPPTTQDGRLVYAITDAAADLSSISRIDMTIDRVETHSTTSGWTTVAFTPQTFNLLDLRDQDKAMVLADAELNAGSYDQTRLHVSSILITDIENQTREAFLPSGELRFSSTMNVDGGSVNTILLDVLADVSLHQTGNGQYIFAPVIQVETREDADVTIQNDDTIVITSGNITSSTRVGMDVQGNVGVNVQIPADANVVIENGIVVIRGSLLVT